MEDKYYPTYRVRLDWVQDGEHCLENPNRHRGLKEGRVHNGTSWNRMYRDRVADDVLVKEAREWWKTFEKKGENPSRLKVVVEYVGDEVWCPSWFSHWMFDEGQTDREVLESFSRYVDRVQRKNVSNGHGETDAALGNDAPFVCLMGAEDRWRWCGSTTGEVGAERTDPPCRCAGCKERGVVRVVH